MLNNSRLCLHTAAQYLLLFLVLAVNSDRFQIVCSYTHSYTLAACSYALLYCIMEADVITYQNRACTWDIIAAYFNTFATPMLEGKQVDTSSFHGNISDWRLKGTIV